MRAIKVELNGSSTARDRASVAIDLSEVLPVSSRPGLAHRRVYVAMAATDVVSMLAGLLLAYRLRFGTLQPTEDFLWVMLLASAVTAPIYLGFGLYRTHQYSSLEEFRRMILAVSTTVTAVVMLSFWSNASYSRLWVTYSWMLALLLSVVTRRFWHHRIRQCWKEGRLVFDTLIVGVNREAKSLADLLSANKAGFRPLGFVATAAPDGVPHGLPVLGSIGELRRVIRDTDAKCLFVAGTAVDTADIKRVLKARRLDGVEVRVTANFPAMLSTTRITTQSVGGVMALAINAVHLTQAQAAAKRVFDVTVSALGLTLLAPLLAAIAIAVKLSSPGTIFFRQERAGQHGRPFTLLKFRTMVLGAELMLTDLLSRNEADGPLFKLRDDPRVTRLGRWLRRYSLDELPQLWNVLKGDMSLVGPRPPLPSEVEAYEDWQLGRLEVKPGISGLWQVSGRSELSFDDYVRLDLFYIENWSIAYDLFIIAKTIPMLLAARGAY
jgi:exopolysaccharide biosynthesis polyprenyl glycosylphosphotransferase